MLINHTYTIFKPSNALLKYNFSVIYKLLQFNDTYSKTLFCKKKYNHFKKGDVNKIKFKGCLQCQCPFCTWFSGSGEPLLRRLLRPREPKSLNSIQKSIQGYRDWKVGQGEWKIPSWIIIILVNLLHMLSTFFYFFSLGNIFMSGTRT